jgi:hypothetical protein
MLHADPKREDAEARVRDQRKAGLDHESAADTKDGKQSNDSIFFLPLD